MNTYLIPEDVQYQLANLKQLTFEVTDACNLNCTYCGYGNFYNDYDQRVNKNMSLKAAFHLLDYLFSLWNSNNNVSSMRVVYISFYGGEPLLNMTFIKEVIKYIESSTCKTRKFVFSMTTNAIMLKQYMEYIVNKNFKLLISLDGNASNTAYRVDKAGKPAFNRIVENIDLLRKTYPDYFDEMVNFNAVLHDKNSVEEIYLFFKERFNKIPSIGELNDMGIRPEKREQFANTYRNSYLSLESASNKAVIEKEMYLNCYTYQSLATYLLRYSPFVYKDYAELLKGKSDKRRIPTGTCLPFSKRMFVTVNGKILPCEKIGHQFYLGTMSEDGVNIDFEAIAKRYNEYFSKLESQCQKCSTAKTCTQCIFNIEGLDDKPVCFTCMSKSDFKKYEAEQFDFLRNHPKEYYNIMENVVID